MPAPAKPPISVCDELDGMPNHQVIRFQVIAATRPANTTCMVMNCSKTPVAYSKISKKVKEGSPKHRLKRGKYLGRNNSSNGVGSVVKAVYKIKYDGQANYNNKQGGYHVKSLRICLGVFN
jgi:hypothetical protein